MSCLSSTLPLPLECPLFPKDQILIEDFFSLNKPLFFDAVIEQTFFCALDPNLREGYVNKGFEILKSEGVIVGLLFNRKFEIEGPPFGGTFKEYEKLFLKKFIINKLEDSANSALPRKGYEFWIEFIKKN